VKVNGTYLCCGEYPPESPSVLMPAYKNLKASANVQKKGPYLIQEPNNLAEAVVPTTFEHCSSSLAEAAAQFTCPDSQALLDQG
jgi:hypothetical protein